MDALTLLIVYLVTQNPEFKGNLAPLAEKLKESEDMLKFLGSLSSFPCPPDAKPHNPPPGKSSAAADTSPRASGQHDSDPRNAACGNEQDKKEKSPCNEGDSPLRTVGGEWIDKYLTKYLQK